MLTVSDTSAPPKPARTHPITNANASAAIDSDGPTVSRSGAPGYFAILVLLEKPRPTPPVDREQKEIIFGKRSVETDTGLQGSGATK
jgi:hypothetical protein